jgi:ferredoxin
VLYVIGAACIADYSCVEACPVDCIHPQPDEPDFERAEQLYIDPAHCIGCDACIEACPVDAVYAAEALPEHLRHYEQVNADYFRLSDTRG